jgi:type III pantothenate kinase
MDFQSIALPSELRYLAISECKYRTIFNLSKTFIKKNQFVYLKNQKIKMILVIDIGNTKIKAAVFEQDTLIFKEEFSKEYFLEELKFFFKKNKIIKKTIISSVANIPEEVIMYLKNKTHLFFVTIETLFPFQNKYETPQTLGIDRKVLVTGAVLKYPNQNVLIIDAGTCITYDFVDDKKNYFGGAISPGISMRYKALNHFTAKLPILEIEDPNSIIGNSTYQSIHSGVVNGILYEMDGFINDYLRHYEHLTIILTGGDALFLAKRLKNPIFANSNFLLESLNLLYQYNT